MIKSNNAEHTRYFFEQGLIDNESYSRNRTSEIREVLQAACDAVNDVEKTELPVNAFTILHVERLKQALLKAGCVDE